MVATISTSLICRKNDVGYDAFPAKMSRVYMRVLLLRLSKYRFPHTDVGKIRFRVFVAK